MNEKQNEKLKFIGNISMFNEVWHEIKDLIAQDKIYDCAFIIREKLSEDEKKKLNMSYQIYTYWSGDESGINLMGLLQYMIQNIWESVAGRR